MPESVNKVTVAAVQMDVTLWEVAQNLKKVVAYLEQAAASGARLIVFPECALTGYGFRSMAEAKSVAYAASSATSTLVNRCRDLNVTAIVGTLAPAAETVYNAALVVTPTGEGMVYHKCHLPFLGVDKFARKGHGFQVLDTPAGKVGTVICYDLRFPESTRTLALRGAEIIAVPTNWPEGAETAPEFVTRARAYENRVFIIAANRVGTERGFTFIGRSQIVSPTGEKLAEADACSESVLTAEIDLALARQKRVIIRPDEFEMDLIGDRRPEIYE